MVHMPSKWTSNDIEFLQNNFKKMSDEQLAEKLNRTPQSVERKRNRLKLKKNSSSSTFTLEEELEIISSNLTYEEIASKYDITREQARYIFRKHGSTDKYVSTSRKWTKEDEEFLKQHYLNKGDKEIAGILNRTPDGVLRKRIKLSLHRETHIIEEPSETTWSEEEIEFLVQNIDVLTYCEIAETLNRSLKAVSIKASKLGLCLNGSKWSEKEDRILKNYRKKSKEELSFLLNRSPKAIVHRANYLQIKIGDKKHKTELERKIERMLKELNIDFKTQRVLGREFNYCADFVIDNIVLEAHGDYWHGNPMFYSTPNEMQELAILKDEIKKSYFEDLGYKVYEIWESEVNQNPFKVKEFIARLVRNH